MKVLVLGGDGYLGWATAMHLSSRGHEICVVDNYLRRKLNAQFDSEPLFPVPLLEERVTAWRTHGGSEIAVAIGDVTDWPFINNVTKRVAPDAVSHFAELPSAPFSMANQECAALVVQNNLGTTLNLIHAVHQNCPRAHIVKIGTMGEYGTPNIDIEEGWLEISHNGRRDKFLYPRQSSSLYHHGHGSLMVLRPRVGPVRHRPDAGTGLRHDHG